ncbi:MAG: hypothetical protein K0S65_4349, partial [Labilithrix sp.]|nr:hypothetical protein [Labilithrix sp.]
RERSSSNDAGDAPRRFSDARGRLDRFRAREGDQAGSRHDEPTRCAGVASDDEADVDRSIRQGAPCGPSADALWAMMTKLARILIAAVAVGLWTAPALAQSTTDKDADAERLFREGQKLMEERRYGEACFKFEAAYKKDQQLGTLLNLAYCHKEQGATWQSWVEFKEAEVKATELKRSDRKDFARQRMAELEKSLARVVVDAQSKVELTEILLEDRRVPEAEKGVTFAAEPGQRKLTFRAKGKKQVVQLVTITKSDRAQRIAVPAMEDQEKEPVVAESAPSQEPPRTGPASASAGANDPTTNGSSQKTVGIILGGVGIVGLGVGAVTGFITLGNDCSKSGKDENRCPQDPAERQAEEDRGKTTGMISNISLGVGAAALVAGAILYFTAPSGTSSATVGTGTRTQLRMTPQIGAGWAGLHGVF